MLQRHFSSSRVIPATGLLWLFIAQLAAVISHVSLIPFWLTFFVIGLAGIRHLITLKKINELTVWTKILLLILASLMFILTAERQLTVENAVAFFVLTYSLKTLELKYLRDAYVFGFLTMFLLSLSLLFSQSVFMTLYVFLALGICFVALMALNTSKAKRLSCQGVSSIYGMLLTAIPMLVVLYLVFPRFGPLWSVPVKSSSAFTGLGETVAPGDVANLARSGKRAFRVAFASTPPQSPQLYWRTLVLDRYDGYAWSRSFYQRNNDNQRIKQQHQQLPWEYEITVDPHNKRWAFALQNAEVVDGSVYQTPDRLVRFNRDLKSPSDYRLSSVAAGPDDLSPQARNRNLRLPPAINPRANEWAAQLTRQHSDPAARVAAVLKHFNQHNYYYTLKPPLLSGVDRVDEFLFDTQRGFCEHYASSMAYVLRQMGVPARVIVGYQGGEWNRQGDFLVVHQYDAHAWVEAWIQGKGWVRYDPTAAVAPSRIDSGIREAMADEGSFLEDSPLALAHYSHIRAISWLRDQVEILNYRWIKMVVNYDRERQQSLFKRLLGGNGILQLVNVTIALTVALFVVVTLVAFFPEWRQRRQQPMHFMFQKLLRKLSSFSADIHPGMTPRQLLLAVEKGTPLWSELNDIVMLMENCLYRDNSQKTGDLAILKQKVRKFNVSSLSARSKLKSGVKQ